MPAHTLKVGDAEIIALIDMPFAIPYEIFFPTVPRAEIDAYREYYPGSTANGMFNTHASAYAIRSQGQTILCDTGMGPGRRLLNNARARCWALCGRRRPRGVDIVVHTHLHGDHVGGTSRRRQAEFPQR
jgi:glyoxylase-like metal-dependent hydrolase (beta-lactamase superfamily II)